MTQDNSAYYDREGIGMLYAGGAGLIVGTSMAQLFPGYWGALAGSAIIALGMAYAVFQRYVSAQDDEFAEWDETAVDPRERRKEEDEP